MNLDSLVLKLQSVRASTKSEANKQLLTECIDEIRMEQILQLQKREEPMTFHVTQRVKLCTTVLEAGGSKLSAEAKAARFLINTIDEESRRAWVVDAFGKEGPQWLPFQFLEAAND